MCSHCWTGLGGLRDRIWWICVESTVQPAGYVKQSCQSNDDNDGDGNTDDSNPNVEDETIGTEQQASVGLCLTTYSMMRAIGTLYNKFDSFDDT